MPPSSSPPIRTAIGRSPPRRRRRRCPLRRAAAGPDDRVAVGDHDLAVDQAEVDDRRDEAVVERAEPMHHLALHRLGGDDQGLGIVPPSSRRPLPIRVPPVPSPPTNAVHLVELFEDLDRRPLIMSAAGWPRCRTDMACSTGSLAISSDTSTAPLEPWSPPSRRSPPRTSRAAGPLSVTLSGITTLRRVALAAADHRQRDRRCCRRWARGSSARARSVPSASAASIIPRATRS